MGGDGSGGESHFEPERPLLPPPGLPQKMNVPLSVPRNVATAAEITMAVIAAIQ